MARHLSPAERAAIVARYDETANASQVAREFGINEKTVRRIASASKPNKAALHARACERAVRDARRSLARRIATVDMYLLSAVSDDEHAKVPGVVAMEPRDLAAVLNAQSNLTARLRETDEHVERKRQYRLTRDKTRAETAFLKARTEALSGLSSALQGATDEELAIMANILERARTRGGSIPSGQVGASAPQSGDDPSDEPR